MAVSGAPESPPLVTLAALHGTGGSEIGPRVAERLGVQFLDRAVPAAVAQRAGLSEQAVEAVEGRHRERADRWTAALGRASTILTAGGQDFEQLDAEEQRIRSEIEAFLTEARHSGGVILGRGGAVVLASTPGVVHVYLGGKLTARVLRIMELEGLDEEQARRSVRAHDRARRDYVQTSYGVDGDDPSHYHLMLDAPALGAEQCVELIVTAASKAGSLEPKEPRAQPE